MIIVKEKFSLLKNIPNVLSLSSSKIKEVEIENGPRKVFVTLELLKKRINHFTKDKVFKLISDIKKREIIHVVTLDKYLLPVGYNRPTKGIVINLSYFNTDDISRVDPRNIYACLVYGICLKEIIEKKVNIKESYASSIINFLASAMVRIYGKEYGLLGPYSTEIPKLRFLLSCYVFASFFGITGDKAYRYSSTISSINYKEIEPELNKYDFSDIEQFIKALSDLKVMPGIERYKFTSKILKYMGVIFLPAFEDLARFIATLTTSDIKGSSVVPAFISRYNEYEFGKIMAISKSIFK